MKRAVEKAAESLGAEVTVGLVNIDQEPELVERYGVRGTPTFVLTQGDRVVQSFSGMSTGNGLVHLVREALTHV